MDDRRRPEKQEKHGEAVGQKVKAFKFSSLVFFDVFCFFGF